MTECPLCGKPWTHTVTVNSGDRFMDTMSAPPYTTFKKHAQVCADPDSIKRAQGSATHTIELYLHTWADLRHAE